MILDMGVVMLIGAGGSQSGITIAAMSFHTLLSHQKSNIRTDWKKCCMIRENTFRVQLRLWPLCHLIAVCPTLTFFSLFISFSFFTVEGESSSDIKSHTCFNFFCKVNQI